MRRESPRGKITFTEAWKSLGAHTRHILGVPRQKRSHHWRTSPGSDEGLLARRPGTRGGPRLLAWGADDMCSGFADGGPRASLQAGLPGGPKQGFLPPVSPVAGQVLTRPLGAVILGSCHSLPGPPLGEVSRPLGVVTPPALHQQHQNPLLLPCPAHVLSLSYSSNFPHFVVHLRFGLVLLLTYILLPQFLPISLFLHLH